MQSSKAKSPTNLGGKVIDFIYSPPHEHRILKAFLGFPVGSALAIARGAQVSNSKVPSTKTRSGQGSDARRLSVIILVLIICILLYFTIISDLQLPDLPRKILGLLMGAFLAFGFAAFVQVRCIVVLIIPMFCSRNGRRYLSALSIVLVLNALPWGIDYLLCWPLRTKSLCKLLMMLTEKMINCDLVPPIPKKFGRLYVDLKEGVKKLPDLLAVNLQYSLNGLHEMYHQHMKEPLKNAQDDMYNQYQRVGLKNMKVQMKQVKDLATDLRMTFDYIKTLLLDIFKVVRRLVDFIFFYIIYQGIKYHNSYVNDINFDNSYITKYFKHIDERRYRRGKRILLPLKKAEAKTYQDPLRLGLASPEIASLFDLLFYKVLATVRDNAHIEYSIEGVHEIKFVVHGSGKMAKLFRKIFQTFNVKEEVDYNASTLDCLPHPYQTEASVFYTVLTLNIIAMCLVLLEIYFERTMHAICGFYYRRRAKERTLHVYNKLLLKRNTFLQRMRSKVKRKAIELEIEHDHNLIYTLVQWSPKIFGKLRCLQKRKCLICDDYDDGLTFVQCPFCPFAYCAFCWRDVEAQCYACRPLEGWANDGSSDDQELAMAD
ncbi:hypothetical protein CAPTEDRAFT_185731 [Capitella teleta]|uniref:Dendritic cell-specific transmembrane protein-like domain-containing protein n=1 Tax=Capitella teleta TaxID=283909 RepID=R7VM56_CAPTE|nr:hypothetical protein CAPTEDRAFT_185731 [Capitella teleta]|eukprot:ELU18255.1 hypothetical protein CAPTEDRAFT_185731 [Capitella teleta]